MAERRFREALLFPHRYPGTGGLGYAGVPYAVEEPDRVRERLDAWAVEHRRSSGPDRDESEPVTRGLAAMAGTWIAERIRQVLELSDALIKRSLPEGASYKDAELLQAQLNVELYDAMAVERPGSGEVEQQLTQARAAPCPAVRARVAGSRLSRAAFPVRSERAPPMRYDWSQSRPRRNWSDRIWDWVFPTRSPLWERSHKGDHGNSRLMSPRAEMHRAAGSVRGPRGT